MWAGAIWNVEFVVYGALIVAIFGLSFVQAVSVVVVGNLFYLLTGLLSLQGPIARTTAFGIGRAAFGPRGNRMPSVFNWVTQVGFEVLGLSLIVLAAIALLGKAGVHSGPGWKLVLILVAISIQTLLPLLGHQAILKALHWLTFPFIGLFVIMASITAGKVNLGLSVPGAGWGAISVAFALVVSAGGLGWTINGNDYSRYLSPDTDKRRLVLAVALGGAIPSILLETLGVALAFTVPAADAIRTTSVNGLAGIFPAWFFWPYLILAIVQLFAINSIDLYSSGVTLQSIGLHLRRYQCVLVDSVVCAGLTGYAIFSQHFSELLADFLLFIIVWLAPWCAIYLTDYLQRGGAYDSEALQRESDGRYFGHRGIHWPAVIAQVVGMVAAAMWLNAYSPYVSPLSSRVGGSDFSIFMGAAFGGATYFVLTRKAFRDERVTGPQSSVV
jgi:purine-cytosine permease-like protein